MSKHSTQDSYLTGKALSFVDFWQSIASELGSSRLRINTKAPSIRYFIDGNSDPKDYLKNAIEQSYKRSNCHHLRDTIDLNAVLDVLGETAYQLQGLEADDLLDIELLEEIAWIISERYKSLLGLKEKASAHPEDATVISLLKTKILQANSRL